LIGLRFDIFERRLTGKPPHIGEATMLWLGLRSGSTPRKNGSSARGLTMTATADLIRATVNNRIDNQRPTRWDRDSSREKLRGDSPPV